MLDRMAYGISVVESMRGFGIVVDYVVDGDFSEDIELLIIFVRELLVSDFRDLW